MQAGAALVALVGLAALPGCLTPQREIGADVFELANISPSNIVPKSSPATFLRAFRSFCLDHVATPETIGPALIGANYVAVPQQSAGMFQSYAVDDSRPLVMVALQPDATHCAVAAEARTGQTSSVETFVAQTWPEAVTGDPATIGPRVERFWLVGNDPVQIITASRHGAPSSPAIYILAISRDRAAAGPGLN